MESNETKITLNRVRMKKIRTREVDMEFRAVEDRQWASGAAAVRLYAAQRTTSDPGLGVAQAQVLDVGTV